MKYFLAWWYAFSLPKRELDQSPEERERTRYERLTSGLTLLILILTLLLTPLSIWNAYNPWSPRIAIIGLLAILLAVVLGKFGQKNIAASLLILSTIIASMGTMLTNPLDPSLVPIFSALVIPVLEAGALIAPLAALVMGAISCVIILLIVTFQHHTPAYEAAMRLGLYSVTVALPITILIFVSVITYIVFRNLVISLQRADRAEEIIALQEQIRASEQQRSQEQQTIEEDIALITLVHAQIANGNLDARVPMNAEHALWAIAGPLNTLLNRAQRWKQAAEKLDWLQKILAELTYTLQQTRLQNRPLFIRPVSPEIDPLLAEIKFLAEKGLPKDSSRRPL